MASVKVGGVYKDLVGISAKIGGVWKTGNSLYAKIGGAWKNVGLIPYQQTNGFRQSSTSHPNPTITQRYGYSLNFGSNPNMGSINTDVYNGLTIRALFNYSYQELSGDFTTITTDYFVLSGDQRSSPPWNNLIIYDDTYTLVANTARSSSAVVAGQYDSSSNSTYWTWDGGTLGVGGNVVRNFAIQ